MGKRIDLTGQRFGRLVVISYNEEVSKQKKGSHWNCKCDCGNEKVVYGGHLNKGKVKSCGCYRRDKCKKDSEDLIGQRFGQLVVIGYNDEVSKQKKCSHLNCRCDCGNEIAVYVSDLKNGIMTSCGCYNDKKHKRIIKDLTGQRFGRLVVISLNEEITKQKKQTCWNCKCDCGNEKVVWGASLKSGNTASCGCYKREESSRRMIQMAKEQWQDEEFRQMHSELSGKWLKERWQDEDMKWKMHYKGGVTPISKYLRSLPVVNQWRKDTYARENNKCQLTGKHVHGGNSDVHHLYGFNMIVLEAHELYNIQVKPQVKDYTEEELHKLEEYVTSWHKDTSNAVLLSEEVHTLFHNCKDKDGNVLYGYGNNTPEQFEEFRERYLNGEFEGLI